jgi:hypothetical protein
VPIGTLTCIHDRGQMHGKSTFKNVLICQPKGIWNAQVRPDFVGLLAHSPLPCQTCFVMSRPAHTFLELTPRKKSVDITVT